MKITIKFYFLLIGICLLTNSCKKLVEIDGPVTSITGKNVYSNDATAASVLTGIYTSMSGSSITGNELTSIGFICGLTADELTLYSGQTDSRLTAYYQNQQSSRSMGDYPWYNIYNKIYTVNSAIEGLLNSNSLTDKVKQQLLGEAKFLRGFYYFYLVNLYGDVPRVTTTDYTTNMTLSRSPETEIWLQIISDLKEAQSLLVDKYLDGTLLAETNERVRPNKWAATALLARCYLYIKDWDNAEKQASLVIDQNSTYHLDSLNEVFTINSKEAIWQLQPVILGWNTQDAISYIISPQYGPSGSSGVYISTQLLNSFEPGDKRKENWINTSIYQGAVYPFAFKYKLNTYGDNLNEYHTILRLSEQYLIRAEARTNRKDLNGAREDIKIIRQRAGLRNTEATNQNDLIKAILHERQIELFTEWGQRWFDLKRTNAMNDVMSIVTPLKGGTWNSNWRWFPIPFNETKANINIKQNMGY